ncbi:MAG: phage tail tape measure protein, partial [Giesbergeria sp.]
GDAVATLPAVLNLAQAGDIGLADASEYVTKAVMGMGLAFSDAGRVADVLAMGANATNTSVSGLAQALSYAAPIAQSAGVSLEGTVAIMGKLADAGIDASRSGTAVANMLAQFQDPASAFKMALADAGITTNNFEEALKQLAASGGKGEKAILAVGLNAGPALRALLNQGMGALDELKKKLEGSAGSAAAAAKVMQDNLAGSMKGLGSAWDTVKNVLGTPVLPVLKDAVDQLAGAFRNAVADGTVQKFGESIATTFQAGIKWVRDFVGTVDFTAVLARLQEFADSANKRFAEVGAYATTAGGVVKLAYGVMSAGINGVLTGIYGMGIVFAETAAGIIRASAYLSESLAKIGFGEAKQRLIKEAAEMRIAVAGLEGVSEEFGKKAAAALNATAQS